MTTKNDARRFQAIGTFAAPAWRGGGDRGPRRERSDRPESDNGPEPEFAPAFLTRDDD